MEFNEKKTVKHQNSLAAFTTEEVMETEETEKVKNANEDHKKDNKCIVKEQGKEIAEPTPDSAMLPPPPKDNFEQEISDLYKAVPEVATHFFIESRVGEGTFSSVYLARLRNCPEIGEKYALKHVTPTSHPSRIENELRCLLKIGGQDSVMGVKLCMRHCDHVVLVMPYLPHEKFQEQLQTMTLKEARDYMWHLLTALKRVHQFNVIHRDVKPSNFLFSKKRNEYALVDFGLATGPMLTESPLTRIQSEKDKLSVSAAAAGSTSMPPPPMAGTSAQMAATSLKSTRTSSPRISTSTTAGCSGIQSKASFRQAGNSASEKRVPLSPTKGNQANTEKDQRSSPRKRPTGKKTFISKQSFTRSLSTSSVDKAQSGVCDCYGKPVICEICIGRKNQVAPRAGTSGFRAPEVLMRCPDQSTAVDIWSAGVIFLSMLSGRYPFFRAQDDLGFLSQIISLVGTHSMVKAALACGKMLTVSETLPQLDLKNVCIRLRSSAIMGRQGAPPNAEVFVSWGDISNKPFDLLAKLLDPNPKTRISAENALLHPFFTDFDIP